MSRPLDDREQEDLVAFLDGELTGDEARVIERKLSLDPTARAEADILRRTWDLLDYLPRPEPSASFTEKTLTRLSAVRGESLLPPLAWRDRRWMSFGAVWVASMAVAMLSGFQGYRHLAPAWAKHVPEEKQEESIGRLPKKLQDEINNLSADKRAARLSEVGEEQEALRKMWQSSAVGQQTWNKEPKVLADFPQEVQDFVKKTRWNSVEESELRRAQGKWPNYAKTIYRLSKEHVAFPPLPGNRVVNKDSLLKAMPETLKQQLQRGTIKILFSVHQKLEGTWPEYALTLRNRIQKEMAGQRLPPLGACTREEFPPETREYIEKQLKPVLSLREIENMEEQERLRHWPEFPQNLMDTARRHGKAIPNISPPGPPGLWKAAMEARSDR